jgi:hypothetical protein
LAPQNATNSVVRERDMAADLGGSQISALLESVPGIRNVLRSPVADALVNMIRAGAGLRPFAFSEAEELVQYSVRRGLINQTEGEQVLAEVRSAGSTARGAKKPAAPKATRKQVSPKKAPKRPTPAGKRAFAKNKTASKKKSAARKPARRR